VFNLTIDTTDIDISNKQQVMYRRLFEYILRAALHDRVRGNLVIPLDGLGNYGQVKLEQFVDVASGNGTGRNGSGQPAGLAPGPSVRK